MSIKGVLALCFTIWVICIHCTAQTITTIAGNGCIRPDSGNSIPATAACIGLPGAGSFDAEGNYYFAEDFGGSRVEKVGTDGIINTVAGNGGHGFSGDGGPATDASIVWAYAIVDAVGNIYIPDRDNYRVRKVDVSTGIIHTIAGNGSRGHSGDGGPATDASIFPFSVCVDLHGNVFVSDSSTWIRKISTTGIITTIAGSGFQGYTGSGIPATSSGLYNSVGLCTDAMGNVLVGNGDGWLMKVDVSTGIITAIGGTGLRAPYLGDGMLATDAQLNPYAIAIDLYGNIFIADYGAGNDRVLKIDTLGIVHSIAGTGTQGFTGDSGPATAAEIYNPEGVAIDACGNVYIADDANRRIRKVTFDPTCSPADSATLSVQKTIVNQKLLVYPNPSHDEVNVTGANKITEISITNFVGQCVRSQKYSSASVRVDMRGLPAGVYIMKIIDETGLQTITKVIKE